MKQIGLNNFQVRKHNKTLFMSLMWRHKQVSKSQLAQLSGLTIPATTKILDELIGEGKIVHSDVALSHRGVNGGSYQLPTVGPWTLDHFQKKLLRLPDTMQTEAGKALAQYNADFLVHYMAKLCAELQGNLTSFDESVLRDFSLLRA